MFQFIYKAAPSHLHTIVHSVLVLNAVLPTEMYLSFVLSISILLIVFITPQANCDKIDNKVSADSVDDIDTEPSLRGCLICS